MRSDGTILRIFRVEIYFFAENTSPTIVNWQHARTTVVPYGTVRSLRTVLRPTKASKLALVRKKLNYTSSCCHDVSGCDSDRRCDYFCTDVHLVPRNFVYHEKKLMKHCKSTLTILSGKLNGRSNSIQQQRCNRVSGMLSCPLLRSMIDYVFLWQSLPSAERLTERRCVNEQEYWIITWSIGPILVILKINLQCSTSVSHLLWYWWQANGWWDF